MILEKLELTDFRNYETRVFEFSTGVNVVTGKNASGKTNILEAIFLLSTGNSFRARIIDEMIRFGRQLGRVNGALADSSDLEVILTTGEVGGQRALKRKYLVDGAPKRKKDFVGLLPAVVFRPEDMDMLTGGSDLRRSFMDDVLSQVSTSYVQSLATYTQALRRRNKLLDAIRDGLVSRYSLAFWDGLLVKHGAALTQERRRLVDYINDLWSRSELFNHLKIVYDSSVISEARLLQYKDEELAAGYTLVGPHKDDFRVVNGGDPSTSAEHGTGPGRDLAIYGSRGEQRMAVLALKLGEIYFLEAGGDEKPLLLLDDIFSELDEVHKREVLRVMTGRQVVVTTAMKEDLELFENANVIELGS
jgi:DNA replication and repair protein RecF